MKREFRSSPMKLASTLPPSLSVPAEMVLDHIRNGTFQRSMSLLVCGTSLISGMEVSYEHYRGSYSNPVMYTPVILSGVLAAAGAAGFRSRRMAKTWMRWASYLTLLDGVIGFGFHIRGVARKPGGWRLPIFNLVMGPPVFAPLLFGTSCLPRRHRLVPAAGRGSWLDRRERPHYAGLRLPRGYPYRPVSEASLRCHRVGTLCSGGEAWYSHYKDNFKYKVQWSPILLTPILAGAALASLWTERVANTALPLASAAAMLNGIVGTGYHVRGIFVGPGGRKKPLYNTLYGPPIFAPMLFAACGLLGMMAYLMRGKRGEFRCSNR